MTKGSVHAILTLILIPIRIPNPRAAKKERTTSPTPNKVSRIRDDTKSKLKRKSAETMPMQTIEIVVNFPFESVISSSKNSVVPDDPTAVGGQKSRIRINSHS